MKDILVICYDCGTSSKFEGRLPKSATCPKCTSYLRCCLTCRFHDPVAYNECREPQAERVKEKAKANYCGFFEVMSTSSFKGSQRKEESLQKLNDLFKKK